MEQPVFFSPCLCFEPTDQHILRHYLHRKVSGHALEPMMVDKIREAELYGTKEPYTVYAELGISESDSLNCEFYFFTLVKKKFCRTSKDSKINERVAGIGTWKGQRSVAVYDPLSRQLIGYRTNLNFQINKRNLNPSWIMHEYKLPGSERCDCYWAFCRVRRGRHGGDKQVASSSMNKRAVAESDPGDFYDQTKKQRSTCYEGSSQQLVHSNNLNIPISFPNSGASTSYYVPPIGSTCNMFQGEIGDSFSQENLHQQPPSHLSTGIIDEGALLVPTALSATTSEVPSEPLHQCGTSATPGQYSFPEFDGLIDFDAVPESERLTEFDIDNYMAQFEEEIVSILAS